jgi:hypothetical protein
MVYLQSGSTSSIVFTLAEKTISGGTNYTFSIQNRDSFETTVFAPTDVSAYPQYYNLFEITTNSGSTSTFTGTSVNLVDMPIGEYHYSAYEMPTANDLDINNAIKLVEVGLLFIVGPEVPVPTYTGNDLGTLRVFNNI